MLPPPWGENDLDKAGEWLESNIDLIEQYLQHGASGNLIRRLHQTTTTLTIPPKLKDSNNGSPNNPGYSSLSPEDRKSVTLRKSFSPESSLEIYRKVSNNSTISIYQLPSPEVQYDQDPARRTSTNSNISIVHSSPSPPPSETVIENFNFQSSSPVTVQPSANNILSCDSAAALAISSRRTSVASCHIPAANATPVKNGTPGSEASRRTSITSDLFQLWLAASPVKGSVSGTLASKRDLTHLEESELFMELIRDVANELDLDVLCHKILVNVSILTHADRGSLFLARGPAENRYLVAKLFDVTRDTGKPILKLFMLLHRGWVRS